MRRSSGFSGSRPTRPSFPFPNGISPTQLQALAKQLTTIANDDAQQILDEACRTDGRDPVYAIRRVTVRDSSSGSSAANFASSWVKSWQENGNDKDVTRLPH